MYIYLFIFKFSKARILSISICDLVLLIIVKFRYSENRLHIETNLIRSHIPVSFHVLVKNYVKFNFLKKANEKSFEEQRDNK